MIKIGKALTSCGGIKRICLTDTSTASLFLYFIERINTNNAVDLPSDPLKFNPKMLYRQKFQKLCIPHAIQTFRSKRISKSKIIHSHHISLTSLFAWKPSLPEEDHFHKFNLKKSLAPLLVNLKQ